MPGVREEGQPYGGPAPPFPPSLLLPSFLTASVPFRLVLDGGQLSGEPAHSKWHKWSPWSLLISAGDFLVSCRSSHAEMIL